MITRDQLRLQIDRLCDTYGDKPFSDQREHLIWEAVEGLEYAQVIKMVDEFISRMRNAPLPNDFSEAAKLYGRAKERYALGEDKPIEEANCKDCLDSGLIRATVPSDVYQKGGRVSGFAPCHCQRGAQIIAAGLRRKHPIHFGPQWRPDWNDDGPGAA